MPSFFILILVFIITYVVFGYLGYQLSHKIKRPVSLTSWVVLVTATFVGSYFMRSARFLDVFTFTADINNALQAIGIGVIIGLAKHEIQLRYGPKDPA